MLWYMSLVICIVLIIHATGAALIKKFGKFRLGQSFLALAIASYLAYVPVFLREYDVVSALISSLHYTMQVLTLDAGYLDQYEVIHAAIGNKPLLLQLYLIVIGVLHISLPLVSAFTVYSFFIHFFTKMRLRLYSHGSADIYIFSQASKQSVSLAVDIANQCKNKTKFLFIDTNEKKNLYKGELSKLNVFFFDSKLSDIVFSTIKKSKNLHYFAISKQEDENLNEALELIDKYKGFGTNEQAKIHIYVFSEQQDIDVLIDSSEKGRIDIHIVDNARMSIYKLIDEYPLYINAQPQLISILILGLDKYGTEALKAALWCGQLHNIDLKITIIDKSSCAFESAMVKIPELMESDCDISFYECELQSPSLDDIISQHCPHASYIIICGLEDADSLSMALRLRRMFYIKGKDFKNKPFIAAHIKSLEKQNLVRNLRTSEFKAERRLGYDIIPFGGEAFGSLYKNIVDSDIMDLSRNVHLAYEEIFSVEPIDVEAALIAFNLFEVNKRSNLANAMHIRYKLWQLGLDYIPDDGLSGGETLEDHLTEDILQKLAYAEHNRWMFFLRSEAWISANMDQVFQYKKEGLSRGRHNCPLLKMHPYICPFEELKERSEQLELNDSTIFDIELIRRIPDILYDKWGATGKKYKIVKKTEEV